MSTIGETADIEAMLQEIGETGSLPQQFAADPGSFFLAVHQQWVKNGGKLDGKNRNSVRNLSELLEADGARVASLTQKLKGETRLKVGDARALLSVYFSRWRFREKDGRRKAGYELLGTEKSEKIRSALLTSVFGDQTAIHLPEREKSRRDKFGNIEPKLDQYVEFLPGRDVILENFKTSKAAITISKVGSVRGPTTASAIRGFCEIIDDHWKIDREDEVDRVLIWIVDPGDRNITNDRSLAAFANAEDLATHFRAIRLWGDADADARWSWLSEHAVVVVGSQDEVVINRLYNPQLKKLNNISKQKDPIIRGIRYSHFLLDTPPPEWLRLSQFTQLYGNEFEYLENGSFLLWLDDAGTKWRYFGYAPAETPIRGKDGEQSLIKALELESPGPIFDRAASVIHAAACFRLDSLCSSISEENRLLSAINLKHHYFAVFRLPEFLNAENLSKTPP
ncbi:MAG: hypothetical protein AAGA21_12565 [Pseudomonadota bacterium]